MKKCPKCGTILDDSKIKCYVCGTDLQRQTLTNFGNSFNENIGATISNNQGNVLSNNAAINAIDINQVNGSFSAGSNFSNSLYNSQLNNLNSMPYDDRTALEKMFSSDERFKSKAEINAQTAMRNNQRRNNLAAAFDSSFSSNQQINQQQNNMLNGMNNQLSNTQQMNMMQANQQMMNQQQPMQQMPYGNQNQMNPYNNQNQQQMFAQRMVQNSKNVQKGTQGSSFIDKIKNKINGITVKKNNNMSQAPKPSSINQASINPNQGMQGQQQVNAVSLDKGQADKKEKPAINWGNDLVKDQDKSSFKGPKMNMIFNIVALIISIVGVLFVYFKFIRNDESGKIVSFNGLKYSISNTFILKEDKSDYRMYAHGEYCTIGISYGSTNAVSTYIDDLYENTKKNFDAENFKVSKSTAKYNDNVWTEIDVISLANNAASANGYTAQTKIQYVAIIYEGNYYKIGYQNTNNDTICSAAYSTFLKTLAFK